MMFKTTLFATLAVVSGLARAAPIARAETHTGDLTFFSPGLGACGTTNTADDLMVAVSSQFFDSFGAQSNGNPICGRKVQISANGKSVTATIKDKCEGCKEHDLDLSPEAFRKLAEESAGRVHNAKWRVI